MSNLEKAVAFGIEAITAVLEDEAMDMSLDTLTFIQTMQRLMRETLADYAAETTRID